MRFFKFYFSDDLESLILYSSTSDGPTISHSDSSFTSSTDLDENSNKQWIINNNIEAKNAKGVLSDVLCTKAFRSFQISNFCERFFAGSDDIAFQLTTRNFNETYNFQTKSIELISSNYPSSVIAIIKKLSLYFFCIFFSFFEIIWIYFFIVF